MDEKKIELLNNKFEVKENELEIAEANILANRYEAVLKATDVKVELFDPEKQAIMTRRLEQFTVYVNKSGQTINVYVSDSTSSSVIGQITKNEVFVVYGGAGSWFSIRFINSSNVLTSGYVSNSPTLPSGFFTKLQAYPYGWWGSYFVFALRRTASVLAPDESALSSLTSNKLVCTGNSIVGENNNGFKQINGYIDTTNYQLYEYDPYAYVDMGMTYGPFGTTMTMYGSFH